MTALAPRGWRDGFAATMSTRRATRARERSRLRSASTSRRASSRYDGWGTPVFDYACVRSRGPCGGAAETRYDCFVMKPEIRTLDEHGEYLRALDVWGGR